VQLNADFGFDDAAAIAPYLAELGVSHLYCSPYLQAAPGSTHGYDVVDHSRVNEELGGAAGHARMVAALAEQGILHVLDVVPNHMAISGPENRWWWDVLENGPSSRYASYFDVDWDPPESKLRNTVLMPILGDHYGKVLEAGDIRLERRGGRFAVRYFDHALPVAPPSLDTILDTAAARVESDELESMAAAFGRLPPSWARDRDSVVQRHRDKEVLAGYLARLCAEQPDVAGAIDAVVAEVNGDADALDRLLERQNYRLAFWRTAGRELDYRRFFDINTLIGLRMEDELVFADTHALVLRWVREGVIDGLRIDHPDGLRDPAGYLERLAQATGGAWVVVEKILEPGERLPRWPVAGTTGYDFLNVVAGLFVDPAGEIPFTRFYSEFTGAPTDWPAITRDKKRAVMRTVLAADVIRMTSLFARVTERNRRFRDVARNELHDTLTQFIAGFPVYRTYVRPGDAASSADEHHIQVALDAARSSQPAPDSDLLRFLADVLLGRVEGTDEVELSQRMQQLTGPVMAKALEDTAFYTFTRFAGLNEVGGDPSRFGRSVEEFHAWNRAAAADWPGTMLTTSTHDTKRSEDVRARLALLSEIPDTWFDAVRRWSTHLDRYRAGLDRPDHNAEYLLYQTLVGAHPLPTDRAVAYMEKASKEAKTYTSWTDPVADYDEGLRAFIEKALADEWFVADLAAFVAPLVHPGRVTSLAQTLLKLTSPGVPDLYQGTELWDLSLVDPDNRRPVDYRLRQRLAATAVDAESALAAVDEGGPKLWLARQALRVRAERPEAFGAAGTYAPLSADGPASDHAIAFARGGEVVSVAPRFVIGLESAGGWRGTTVTIPSGHWVNRLTGEAVEGGDVRVDDVTGRFPVALLVRV
jgi:(1->4)-alpha-D-glucan 1-alpha-D-glucosylmutase